MKTFAVVTSMDHAYYEKCGLACIESFGAFWPRDIPLYVYDEGIEFPVKRKWVTYLPWSDLGPDYNQFSAGNFTDRTKTFAKKAYSIMAALNNINVDRLIWMDADVVSTYSVNAQLLDMITPDRVLSTHYGVKHDWPSDTNPSRISFSCETGFFILNRRHPDFDKFTIRYAQYYNRNLGQSLRRFYDGEVYGAVVQELESRGVPMLELNPGQKHKTPIPRSVMAPYITHYKAGAKEPYTSEQLLAKHQINHADSSIPQIDTAQQQES